MASSHVNLGKIIQQLRLEAGFTQDELSDKAQLAYSTLAKIERGAIKNPSVFTVAGLAQALGVSVETLLNLEVPESSRIAPTTDTKIKFFYSDMNGVLVRFFQRAFVSIAEQSGAPLDKVETTFWHYNYATNKGEMTMAEFNKVMGEQLDMPKFDFLKIYLASIEPIKAMHECIVQAQKHMKVGLLTNTDPGFVKTMRAKGLIPDIRYDAIIDSSEVGSVKPEPQIYEMAEKAAGVSGSEILFADDSRTNLMAAERFGWRVLWFDDYRPEESVRRIEEALNYSSQ